MINHFTFNGTSTAQLGLIVSGVSIFGAGSRKVEKAGIPGRNGDLQIELGGFNNYTVRYTVSITKNFTTTAQQIREWLLESKGYCDLTDTYHPDEIRKACFNSDIEFTTSMLYKYGQASIQFDCLPERYLTTNTPITTTATADTTTDTTMSLSTVPTPINISLNGNTTQEGTPTPSTPQAIHNVSGDNEVKVVGKNVLGLDLFVDETFYNVNENGSITVKLSDSRRWATVPTTPTLPQGAYTFSRELGYGLCDIRLEYENYGTAHLVANTVKTYTFTLTQPSKIKMKLGYSYSSYPFTETVQLEKGSTATTYEPYTRQSYPLYLPVENLLTVENGESTVGGVTFKNTDKGIQINGSTPSSTFMVLYDGTLPSGEYTISGMDEGASANTYQIVIYKNGSTILYYRDLNIHTFSVVSTDSILIRLFVYSGQGEFGGKTIPLQLNKGANANHYTPYGTSPIELNKIGTYQDYIYKNGGKWYVHKETGKVDLGTLTWAKSSSGNKYSCTAPQYRYADNMKMFCTAYTFDGAGNSSVGYYGENGTIRYYYSGGTATYELYVHDERGLSASDFKNAVSGVILVYLLRTTTDTEITDTTLINQLNNIEKAYSYNGTTNILQVSNDNGFMLEVVSLHGSTFNSNYKGEPIITVNSTGLIYLNGEVMEVLSAPVTINCQTMQCYNGVVNMNNEVRVNDFPEIKIGGNEVGSSMALTITPNNWRH